MRVMDIMKKAYIIDRNITLKEAAKVMSSKRIGSLIFISKGKVSGILTERDVLKNFGKSKRIMDVMSKRVVTIDPDSDVNIALGMMRAKRIKKLPVVGNKKLMGVINLTDIAGNCDLGEVFFFD